MQKDRQKTKYFEYAGLFAVVFTVMFVLSLQTPLIADDFNYAFGYSTGTRIRSLSEIWKSMYWHRKMLNPRVFSHACLSFVLMYPRWVFSAINGAMAVFFSWTTVEVFSGQGSKHPIRDTVFACMLLWICMPGFGQVFFWTAGACNYFWGIALTWFIVWRALRLEEDPAHAAIRVFLLVFPTFIAGAWSEHISFAMLMILFLLLVCSWKRNGCFPWSKAVLLLSGCAGYLFLMLAPAAKVFQRMHDAGDPTEESNLTRILSVLPHGTLPMFLGGCVLAAAAALLLRRRKGNRFTLRVFSAAGALCCGLITFAAAVKALKDGELYDLVSSTPVGFFSAMSLYCALLTDTLGRGTKRERILLSMILAFSGLCGFSLFLFGEYFPIRGFCAPVSLLILAAMMLAGSQPRKGTAWKRNTLIVVLVLCFALCFYLGAADILKVHRAAVLREADFAEAAAGDRIVIVTPYVFQTKYTAQYGNPDLAPDAGWPNGDIADYYGVDRIIVR